MSEDAIRIAWLAVRAARKLPIADHVSGPDQAERPLAQSLVSQGGGVPRMEFDLQEENARPPRIVDRVGHDEEVAMDRAGSPVVKVIPATTALPRMGRGTLAGQLDVAPDWDNPSTNGDIAEDFGTQVV
jgi:antitoxin (DNA-binding transcriptional repressor) of toxin-antitoxin stability system